MTTTLAVVTPAPSTAGEARCSLTELIIGQCAHCRGHALPDEYRIVRWLLAPRAGSCAQCDGPYAIRDRIAKTAAGEHLHRECAS